MNVYGEISGVLSSGGRISGELSSGGVIVGTLTVPSAILPPPYEGEHEFTPTTEVQTIAVKDKWVDENIVINPIPNNYGLITYNGTSITVS